MKTLLLMYTVFGLLLAALAVPLWLEKIPPNGWYGFRVSSICGGYRRAAFSRATVARPSRRA